MMCHIIEVFEKKNSMIIKIFFMPNERMLLKHERWPTDGGKVKEAASWCALLSGRSHKFLHAQLSGRSCTLPCSVEWKKSHSRKKLACLIDWWSLMEFELGPHKRVIDHSWPNSDVAALSTQPNSVELHFTYIHKDMLLAQGMHLNNHHMIVMRSKATILCTRSARVFGPAMAVWKNKVGAATVKCTIRKAGVRPINYFLFLKCYITAFWLSLQGAKSSPKKMIFSF